MTMNKIPISLLFATGRVGSPVVTDGVNVKLADDPSVFPDTLSRSQQQLTQRIQVVEQSVQSIQLNLDTLLPDVAGVKNLSIKNSESASTLHQQVHQHAGAQFLGNAAGDQVLCVHVSRLLCGQWAMM